MTKCTSIALAHDFLTQRGGAERVALQLARMFPDAPLYTAVHNTRSTFAEFSQVDVRTSMLQRSNLFRRDPRYALPLLAHSWSRTFSDADVTLVSSSGWAHGIRTRADGVKVVYCHNPPRWLYQQDEYLTSRAHALAIKSMSRKLRKWDLEGASSASLYIANSNSVAERIRRAYGIEPTVVHPPVCLDTSGVQEPVSGLSPGYFITVARRRAYKNTSAIVEAFRSMPNERLVIVGAPEMQAASSLSNVRRLGVVSDGQLRWLYAHARALITLAYEDFGLTPLEANSLGTPALALRAGGHLDSIREGVSGFWIESAHPSSVVEAVRGLCSIDEKVVRAHAGHFSPNAFRDKIREAIEASQTRALL